MTGLPEIRPAVRIGNYQLLTPLAEGGMATVWLARTPAGTRVALKLVKERFWDDADFHRMFEDELRIAELVRHPNLVDTLEIDRTSSVPVLAMEYVPGESLSRLRRAAAQAKEAMPIVVALRIAADLCAGLHAAHELADGAGRNLGVIHRDVSPQNVLVTATGVVKLIDFGIARLEQRQSTDTADGHFKGKAPYMAPEQLGGGPIDRRVDVWSVGVTLHELIAGRLPFEGTQSAIFSMLLSSRPPPPLRRAPERVRALLRRALARDPARRIATAGELGREIELAISELGVGDGQRQLAAFVERHLGDRLQRREAFVRQVIDAVDRGSVAPDPMASGPMMALSAGAILTPSEGSGPIVTQPPVALPERRSWVPMLLIGAVAALGIGCMQFLLSLWQ